MHAAAAAAVPFNIPMAHIGGGEITEGAIDDSLRHSLTKLSHLHFVYTKEYARRLERMGEEPWRITVCSAPNLDNARLFRLLSAKELEQAFPFRLSQPLLLVTFHPVTRELDRTQWQVSELMAALEASDLAVVITAPNADPGNQVIRESAARWVAGRPNAWMVENLGPRAYFSMMALAAAMIGNSSSGIVEAASFKLPTVNIGTRQQGRARAKNIIDVGYSRQEILSGIRRAVSPEFRDSLRGLSNPYGEGEGAPKILSVLKQTELGDRLLRKRFYEPGDGR
jgi:UDP-hydrolysing UDP-N-acetyl-D-glucosamine 2-epimerase